MNRSPSVSSQNYSLRARKRRDSNKFFQSMMKHFRSDSSSSDEFQEKPQPSIKQQSMNLRSKNTFMKQINDRDSKKTTKLGAKSTSTLLRGDKDRSSESIRKETKEEIANKHSLSELCIKVNPIRHIKIKLKTHREIQEA